MKDLHQYQRDGVDWIAATVQKERGVLLGDDMGLGKTIQVLSACERLLPDKGRVMVVCPALARETWRQEIEGLGKEVALAVPKNDKRWGAYWELCKTARYVVSSYELLEHWWKQAFQRTQPMVLCADEAHLLKGRDTKGRPTKRAGIVRDLSVLVPYRILLTGTPLADRPRDLYNLLTIMAGNQKRWGSSWAFDRDYCDGHQGEWGWDNKGKSNEEELRVRLQRVLLRREKRDVAAQLPSLTRQVMWMDGDQKGVDAFARAMTVRSGSASSDALLATLEAKMQAAIDLAVSARKFLLLTWLKDHAREMSERLTEQGVPNALITGDLDTARREKIVEWAAEQGIGVVATLDSVWQSMNSLKKVTSFGIMHALSHQWVKMAQGEARLHRIGQTDPVHWVYLACRDTMDELVIQNIVEKMDQFRALMPSSEEATALRDTLAGEDDLKLLYEGL